ncbi:Zn-dependent hydrolase [Gracilibacillus alcaliphilus]|uniref:Zn-dependent hydrolase n=1 Tax=Gracilibacillus alcaliphilus TaxID=1401441 RepID=UPI00195703DF|nr:Zn-dependent hydrolase [Gracilibacillus alcaliphilus]MBM7677519.1 allantoate deiminase [Gracilibacillus alcaliphilus]
MTSLVLKKLEWLAAYGRDGRGGITRLVYSEAWYQAQQALKTWLEEEGFNVEIDAVGNLIALIPGAERPDEHIMTGSHLDSVVSGGIYDGQYGIIGGALSVLGLVKKHGRPRKTIAVVAFAEEEGSRFPYAMWGSKSMFGKACIDDVKNIKDAEGVSMENAMKKWDYSGVQEPREQVKAFIELHIEQGSVLETEEIEIGIVHSIVGQRRLQVTVIGEVNHAGTTPMGYRKDAMKAASQMVSSLLSIASAYGDPLVATIGRFELEPNIPNVVPGKAIFTLDIRHIDKSVLEEITEEMTVEMERIAKEQFVEISIETWFSSQPVPMDNQMIQQISQSCEDKHITYKWMHSGAAHDSQVTATMVPTAMIFVPSQSGISHSPFEFTAEQSLVQGMAVLEDTLFKLAY